MIKAYRPPLYDKPMKLLLPITTTVLGVPKKTFPEPEEGLLFFGSFKTYGGTETTVNGVYSVEDTANIETWFRPDIVSGAKIYVPDNNGIYEIIGEPENLNLRGQRMKFKVRRVKGGA